MRLFDTGLRIFGGFLYSGVFVLCVEALFGTCLGVWSCLPERQSLVIIRHDLDFDDKILSVHT